MSSNSSNKKSSGWIMNEGKYDADAHARDLEQNDTFNRMVDEVAQHPGGLRKQLEALANTDNAEVIAALAEHGITSARVPQRFRLSNGQEAIVWADDAGWHSAAIFDGAQINFSEAGATRDECLMLPEKYLQQNSGPHFKELDEGQLLNIARLAQNGSWQEALGAFLYFRLGNVVTDMHPEQIASNPAWLPVMNEAVYYVFRHMNNSYVETPEAEASLAKFAGDRPLTISLCRAWWLAYQEELGERRAAQADAPANERQPAPTPEELRAGLESLTDRQLADLKTKTLRERGRRVIAFDRQMFSRE